jgi:hypothetical protein
MQSSCKRDVPPSSAPECSEKALYYHPQNLCHPTSTHSSHPSTKVLNPTPLFVSRSLYFGSPAAHTLIPISPPQSSPPLHSRLHLSLINLLGTRGQTARTLPILTMMFLTEYCKCASLVCGEGVAAQLPVERGSLSEDVPAEGIMALQGVAHRQR